MTDQTFGQSSVQHMSIQTRFLNLQHWLKYIPGNRYTHPSLQFTVLSQLCKIVKQHHSTNEKKSLQKKNSIKVFSANLFSFVILEIKIWKKYAYHISKTDKVIELLYTPDLSLLVSYLEDCLPLAMLRSFIEAFYQSQDGSRPLTSNASPKHSQKCPSSFTLCIKMYWIQYSSTTAF